MDAERRLFPQLRNGQCFTGFLSVFLVTGCVTKVLFARRAHHTTDKGTEVENNDQIWQLKCKHVQLLEAKNTFPSRM